MTDNVRSKYVALRIVESVCFVHGTVRPSGHDSNRIDLQFIMEFEEAQSDLAPWIASGKRVVADLKVVDEQGHPANTPIGAFANPVLDGGEIMAPTGSGDSASVALYVSSGHFDFLAAHRAQWDRLLVRVQPADGKDGTRLAITGYTFTDRKARPGK
jgi:hypothetical protein